MSPSYTIANAVWPDAVAVLPAIQRLIAQFYEIADLADPKAGERLAEEVFTTTGIMAAGGGHAFRGEAGMEPSQFITKGPRGIMIVYIGLLELGKSREKAWDAVSSRRHRIQRVFVADAAGLDLVVTGKVEVVVRATGKVLNGEFAARLVVDQASVAAGQARLSSSTVWADTWPLVSSLGEQDSTEK